MIGFWLKAVCLLSVVSIVFGEFYRKIYGSNEEQSIDKPLLHHQLFVCSAKHLCRYVVRLKDGSCMLFSGDLNISTQGIESIWVKEPIQKPAAPIPTRLEATRRPAMPVCTNAIRALGMESRAIPDDRITASSSQGDSPTYKARLNSQGSWTASGFNDREWLQVDLGKKMLVYSVATQGSSLFDSWIWNYEVLYSIDGIQFTRVKDASNNVVRFPANYDRNSIVKRDLPSPVVARYIHINPKHYKSVVAVRLELYGCDT